MKNDTQVKTLNLIRRSEYFFPSFSLENVFLAFEKGSENLTSLEKDLFNFALENNLSLRDIQLKKDSCYKLEGIQGKLIYERNLVLSYFERKDVFKKIKDFFYNNL